MPKKGKKLDENKIQQHMGAYSEATTAALLDEAFGRWDSRTDGNHIPFLDRGDHIIIGGQTATELLMERFNAEFPTLKKADGSPWNEYERSSAYGDFLQTQGKQYINQMVTSALATGEKVEVFVPDKTTGKIKDQPMALTSRGFEPAGPLAKPKQLNGWQKFWNKFGFYQKEKAAVVNYEKEAAARQKVQFCNKAAQANLCGNSAMAPSYLEEVDKFHPEVREDMAKSFPQAGGDPAMMGHRNGFKTARSSFYTTVMEVMATKRDKDGKLLYTNEQIFDMSDPKMQKARADAFKETYDHYKAGDTDWLVDVQYEAATVLVDRMNQQVGKLDFTKPNLTEQKGYREFAMLSDTAFDQSQDMIDTKVRMDEKYGKGAYWDAAGKVGACAQVYRHFNQSLNAQKYLVNGVPGKSEDMVCSQLSVVFKGQAFQQEMGRRLKEQPERKFSDAADLDLVSKCTGVVGQAGYDDQALEEHKVLGTPLPDLFAKNLNLAREQISNPEKFGKQIASGVLEGRMKLQELSADGEEPSKFEIRNAATVEREMKRQPQKTGGGPEL